MSALVFARRLGSRWRSRGRLRALLGASAVCGVAAALAACVEVPANIRAQFAAAADGEPSNYRRGSRGVARPVVSPSVWDEAFAAAHTNPGQGSSDAGPTTEDAAVAARDAAAVDASASAAAGEANGAQREVAP